MDHPPPRILPRILSRGILLWIGSLRPVGTDSWPDRACIVSFWHGDLAMALAASRHHPLLGLVSRSRDGDLLDAVLAGTSIRVLRGSTGKTDPGTLRALLGHLRAGGQVITALDGPRGPAGVMKPGAAWLAARAGVPHLRFAFDPCPGWTLDDWSRMRLPRPGARLLWRLEPAPPLGESRESARRSARSGAMRA